MIAASRFAMECLSAFDRVIPPAMRTRASDLTPARRLVMLAAITGVSAPLLAVMYHFLRFDAAGMVVLTGGMVMLLSPLALNVEGGLTIARELFVGALYVLKVWLAFHLGGIAAPTMPWFLLCPMVAMLLGGTRPGLIWSGVVSVTVLVIFQMERVGGKFVPHPVADQQILDLVSILGLFALSTIIVLFFRADSLLASEQSSRDSVMGRGDR